MNNFHFAWISILIYVLVNIYFVETVEYCGINGSGILTWCADERIPHCCGFSSNGQNICCNKVPRNMSKDPTYCGKNKGLETYCLDVDYPKCCGFQSNGLPRCCPGNGNYTSQNSPPVSYNTWYLWLGAGLFVIVFIGSCILLFAKCCKQGKLNSRLTWKNYKRLSNQSTFVEVRPAFV